MATFAARNTNRARTLRNNATDCERRLWSRLQSRQMGGWKFSRQMPLGAYFVDFLCREAKLIIELDGGQHGADADAGRTRFLEEQGYRVIRFWNNELVENEEGVLAAIRSALPTPNPSRLREGN